MLYDRTKDVLIHLKKKTENSYVIDITATDIRVPMQSGKNTKKRRKKPNNSDK